MDRSFEVMAPVLEALDNGEHFPVVDIVIAFCWNTLPRPECDWVQDSIGVGLGNNARDGESRGISVECNREFRIEVTEYWR